jgi:multidrug resistance efflux pump
MRIRIGSVFLLFIITIFSVLYFGVTAIAQELSPAQTALAIAKTAVQEKEQQLSTAQATLESATAARQELEQQLVAAKAEEVQAQLLTYLPMHLTSAPCS